MVFFATPVMRTVERMELPSTRAETTWTCCALLNLFILTLRLSEYAFSRLLPPYWASTAFNIVRRESLLVRCDLGVDF